jgi:hypothetical protein
VVFSSIGLELAQRRLEGREELVRDRLHDDEALGGATGLPAIIHPAPDRPFDGVGDIGVLQHDEGVAAAKLHRGWLQILARLARDDPAGRGAAGQRHALDAPVVDDVVGLRMRDQQVGVEAGGRPRVQPQLLEGDGALRHASGMLHHHGVAGHQMGTRDPRQLIIGKIPGFDAEHDADRAALHMADAMARMKRHIRQKALGVLGVIGQNLRTELDLAFGLADPLAHFQRHDVREMVGLIMQQLGRLVHDLGAVGIARVLPGREAGGRGRDFLFELLVRDFVERFDECIVERINA